jgi:hypothetical protein
MKSYHHQRTPRKTSMDKIKIGKLVLRVVAVVLVIGNDKNLDSNAE